MARRRAKFAGRRFTSGQLKVNVKFNDNDTYSVRICPTERGARCETVSVGAIASGAMKGGPTSRHGKRIGYEDPRAMLSAARAGISFSRYGDHADYNRRGTHALVKPVVRKRRKR